MAQVTTPRWSEPWRTAVFNDGLGPRWAYLEFEGLSQPPPDTIHLTLGPLVRRSVELRRCPDATR
jgi:hypothetical protein